MGVYYRKSPGSCYQARGYDQDGGGPGIDMIAQARPTVKSGAGLLL